MTSIPLIISQPHPCSYLDGHTAQASFVSRAFPMTAPLYSQLIGYGYRRSGDDVYKPSCPSCRLCVPSRLLAKDFKPNRSQKRCQKTNSGTVVIIKPPLYEQAHFDLYLRYQLSRHHEGGMADCTPGDYLSFLSSTWCNTHFVEFSIANKLAAVAVVDQLDNALSAVYTFFDPDLADHSLGTYAVLWQVQQALQQQLEFVYLGFWVDNSQKMAYKSHFRPLQLLSNGQWF